MKSLIISTSPIVIRKKGMELLVFKLIFPIERDLKAQLYLKILDNIICTTNHNFNNSLDYKREIKKKSIISLSLSWITEGDKIFIIYEFRLPRENIIKDYNIEESFQFVVNNLFNPYTDGDQFNLDKFNYERDYFLAREKDRKKDFYGNNSDYLLKIIDKEEELVLSNQTRINILANVTSRDLYTFYEKNILNNDCIKIVYGNIKKEKINSLFQKYFSYQEHEIKLKIRNLKFKKLLNYKEIKILNDSNQTEVDMFYQIDNMKKKDINYLEVIFCFLQYPENRLLMKKLRNSLGLVYNAFITEYLSRGLLLVTSYTRSEDQKKVVEAVKQLFKELNNYQLLETCLQRLLKSLEMDRLKEEDNPYRFLNRKVHKIFKISNISDLIKIYRNMKVDDILSFVNRIRLTNLVIFEGTKE